MSFLSPPVARQLGTKPQQNRAAYARYSAHSYLDLPQVIMMSSGDCWIVISCLVEIAGLLLRDSLAVQLCINVEFIVVRSVSF